MDDVKAKITLDGQQAIKEILKIQQASDDFVYNFVSGIKLSNNTFDIFKGNLAANLATKAITLMTDAIKDNAKEALEFKRAQLQIETILPANTKLTKDLTDQLVVLSEQYGTTASSQAKTYYEIISAGVEDASDGTKLLAQANQLATGGVTETAKTIDLLTTIYNVYGKEIATTSAASDSLFKTAQIGKTNIAELASSLGQALPIAKSFGIGLDEVGAVLSQLTNAGISTAESVTLLNAILSAIAKNGEKLGAGFNSTAVQTDGLGVVIERLMKRTHGSNDALFELLGRQEAVRAVQSLGAKGLENYNSVLAQYTEKTGVAAEASKKIIDNDLGKQFDILGSKISSTARGFIDIFVPATLMATKALNDFLTPGKVENEGQVARGLEQTRKKIAQLEETYKSGRISSDAYNRTLAMLSSELAAVSNAADTAKSPLVLIATGLEKDAENIKAQIGALKNGFTELELSPIERDLKIEELNAKLATTTERIKELTKVNTGVSNVGIVAPTTRTDEAIANEIKMQADLSAIRAQFAIEDKLLSDNLYAQSQTDEFARKQLEIEATFNSEAAKLAAVTEAELEKTRVIKDAQERRATQDKIIADAQLKALKLQGKKELEEKENIKNQEKRINQGALDATGNFLQAGIMLAKEGSAVQKGLMIAQATINTYAGATRAMADYPFPASVGVAASVVALGLANVAKISGAKFEQGGFVPGLNQGGDNIQIRANPGEAILNTPQQKEFMDIANGRSSNSNINNLIERLINALLSQPINVLINDRVLGSALRDLKASGFAI